MKITRILFLFLLLCLVLPAAGRSAQAAPARQTNLLTNPSLEQPYSNGAANGWGRWHQDSAKIADCAGAYYHQPTWQPELNGTLVLDGAASQHIGNQFDTWHAGVMQNVSVTAGSRYRFTFWARGRASNEQFPAPSDGTVNLGVRAGIDPNGSGLWSDGDIAWSGSGSPHDNWQSFSVEATATGGTITIFAAANLGGANQCRAHLDVWFDKAELIVAGPPPTNTPPPQPTSPPPPPATNTPVPPTATSVPPTSEVPPTETPAPTSETPTDVPTNTPAPVQGGAICLNAFADSNANGLHEAAEGYMAGVTFTIAQNNQVLTQGVSQGTDSPICFESIPEGSYQVAQIVPRALEMTTAASIDIDVTDGETIGLEFGSRVIPPAEATEAVSANATANPAATATAGGVTIVESGDDEDGSLDVLALSGLGILAVAVLLLGVLIVVLVRQRA
jgi:cell division septation protein DedD